MINAYAKHSPALLNNFSLRASPLLDEPTKLAALLQTLEIEADHLPASGVFMGRCPL